jgi:hypothetical protein
MPRDAQHHALPFAHTEFPTHHTVTFLRAAAEQNGITTSPNNIDAGRRNEQTRTHCLGNGMGICVETGGKLCCGQVEEVLTQHLGLSSGGVSALLTSIRHIGQRRQYREPGQSTDGPTDDIGAEESRVYEVRP